MNETLKENFVKLVSKFTQNNSLINELWSEIEQHYTEPTRHYHNLIHIATVYNKLSVIKGLLVDWDMIQFSVFYHDIFYDTNKNDNELNSALLAKNNLQKLAIEDSKIGTVFSQVLATQSHQNTNYTDTNYFTDADLSIFGESWDSYRVYSKQIRAEYIQYDDEIYVSGRIKVLNHFIEMERIFKTPHFYNLYELKAKQNLENEIKLLKQNL
jgi:predicted metal-dependent HD superfamily phosphohydrolase